MWLIYKNRGGGRYTQCRLVVTSGDGGEELYKQHFTSFKKTYIMCKIFRTVKTGW